MHVILKACSSSATQKGFKTLHSLWRYVYLCEDMHIPYGDAYLHVNQALLSLNFLHPCVPTQWGICYRCHNEIPNIPQAFNTEFRDLT